MRNLALHACAACLVAVLPWAAAATARADEAPPPPPPAPLDEPPPALAPPPVAGFEAGRLERRGRPLAWFLALEGGVAVTDDPEGMLGVALPPGVTPLRWDANEYDAEFAARITVGRYVRPCERVEVRGSWTSWEDASRQTGQFGFTQTPGGPTLISPPATATLRTETDLWSVEANWWRTLPSAGASRFEVGLGARVIRFEDEAQAADWVGLAGPGSFLEGEAENTLWALQGGVAWRLGAWRPFEVAVGVKGMVGFLDRDLGETDRSIVTGGATADASREETDFGWALEGEVTATFRPVPRVGITASYTLLVLGGVTRATGMLDFSRAMTGSVQLADAQDDVLVHSLFLGVRIDL